MDSFESLDFLSFVIFSDDPLSLMVIFLSYRWLFNIATSFVNGPLLTLSLLRNLFTWDWTICCPTQLSNNIFSDLFSSTIHSITQTEETILVGVIKNIWDILSINSWHWGCPFKLDWDWLIKLHGMWRCNLFDTSKGKIFHLNLVLLINYAKRMLRIFCSKLLNMIRRRFDSN